MRVMKRKISSSPLKSDQIRVRLSTRDKEILELAAKLDGCSVSDYLRRAGLEAARRLPLGDAPSPPSAT